MSDLITLDWETYYDRKFSLSKMTTQEYILSHEFEEIGVGIKVNDAPSEWFTGSHEYLHKVLHELDWSKSAMLAHNTMFDGAIAAWKHGIIPTRYYDTLSMARPHFGTTVGGSLAKVAKTLGVGVKGTEVVMALGKRKPDFTEAEMSAYGQYCRTDVDLCYDIFKLLLNGGRTPSGLMLPAFPKQELLLIHDTIHMYTEPMLELDGDLLRAHLRSVKEGHVEALRNAIKAAAEHSPKVARLIVEARMKGKGMRDMLMSNPIFAAILEELDVPVPMKVSARTGKEAPAFAKTDQGMTDLLHHENPAVQAMAAARLRVKSTIEETRTERFINLSKLGPFPAPLNYCGAYQTWRWSGGDKLNLQNLPRGGTLRRAMLAPEGHMLVVADSSNIELRVNHTLAGQAESIEAFKQGKDLYCEFASILYGRTITKADKDERMLGKLAHLSLGYGCGWQKFQQICRMNKVSLDDVEAKRVVDLWRATYHRIPAFWRAAGNAIEAMAIGSKTQVDHKGLICTAHERLVTAPSHFIRYPELERTEDGWTYQNRNQRKKVYGGLVVENICQHIARNILADQWAKIHVLLKRYFPQWRILLQVHDEFALCGPEAEAQAVYDMVLKVMCTSPAWWPEVPLAAEGDIARTYGDAK